MSLVHQVQTQVLVKGGPPIIVKVKSQWPLIIMKEGTAWKQVLILPGKVEHFDAEGRLAAHIITLINKLCIFT